MYLHLTTSQPHSPLDHDITENEHNDDPLIQNNNPEINPAKTHAQTFGNSGTYILSIFLIYPRLSTEQICLLNADYNYNYN